MRLPEKLIDENGITMPNAFSQFLKQTVKELRLPHGPAARAPPARPADRPGGLHPVAHHHRDPGLLMAQVHKAVLPRAGVYLVGGGAALEPLRQAIENTAGPPLLEAGGLVKGRSSSVAEYR